MNDIVRVEYILNEYDTVERLEENEEIVLSTGFKNANNEPAPMLKYTKRINGTYYVVEAIPDSHWKKVWIVSAYVNKNIEKKTHPRKCLMLSPQTHTSETSSLPMYLL